MNWFLDPTDPIPARFTDGLAVPDWLRNLLLCDGTVTPVFTANRLPVSVGRTQYQVPDRTRRLVLARDRKCRVPWCSQTRWLQVHHIIHDQHHVRPTRGTWPGCARRVTGCIIKANSASLATPTSLTGSPSPTPTAT